MQRGVDSGSLPFSAAFIFSGKGNPGGNLGGSLGESFGDAGLSGSWLLKFRGLEGLGSSGRLVGTICAYPGTYECPA